MLAVQNLGRVGMGGVVGSNADGGVAAKLASSKENYMFQIR